MGGSRGAAFANTFQTIVFMIIGLVAFLALYHKCCRWHQPMRRRVRKINEKGLMVQDYQFDRASTAEANEPPKPIGRVIDFEKSNLTNQQPHFWREPVTVEFKKKIPKSGEFVPFERAYCFSHLRYLSFYSTECGNVSSFISTLADCSCSAKSFRLTVIAHPPLYHGGLGSMCIGWSTGKREYCLLEFLPLQFFRPCSIFWSVTPFS